MRFDCFVDKEVFDCLVSAEKRGHDSRRGEMSKAQYHQKSRFVDLSSKKDRRKRHESKSEHQRRWLLDYVGTTDVDVDSVLETLEDAGFKIDIKWRAQGPKTNIMFANGYDDEIMQQVRENGWKSVFRKELGLEVK
jgi:hypothetical protein